MFPERGRALELSLDPDRELGVELDPGWKTGALDRGLVIRLLGMVALPRGWTPSEVSFSVSGSGDSCCSLTGKRALLLVLGLTTLLPAVLPDPLDGCCLGSLAAVGAGCSRCRLRDLLLPLPPVALVDNPRVEAGLDLVELLCAAVELRTPVVLLVILASVGKTSGRVEATDSVGTGVSRVGRKGGLVMSFALDRGCSTGWSGCRRRRWISGLCLFARWSAWSSWSGSEAGSDSNRT